MKSIAYLNMARARMTPAKYIVLVPGVAAVLLVAFAFLFTSEPVFFLRWFFGLQADD